MNLTQIKWKHWTKGMSPFKFNPTMQYSDIIVPTIDTIRTAYLTELLVNNKKQVLTVGATGTGKTSILTEKLLNGMSAEYIPQFLMFSAKTSANQTQVCCFTQHLNFYCKVNYTYF